MILKNTTSKKQLREFGLLVGFVFPVLIGWILPVVTGHVFRVWTLWIGVPSLMLGIWKPLLLLYPYKAWMKLGQVLGRINSHIILGIVFFMVLQPIALIMKLFGYDPLRKKKYLKNTFREDKQSYKIDLTRIF